MNGQSKAILPFDTSSIFSIQSEKVFNEIALKSFHHQFSNNKVYQSYCEHLNITKTAIDHYTKIPFLPISFFKTHRVASFEETAAITFSSSGTTGMQLSQHHVKDLALYEQSFIKGFEYHYGSIDDYLVLALLPSYLEREGSSLVYMCEAFIQKSMHKDSGFFLNDYARMLNIIAANTGKKILLIGVSYALLDLAEKYNPDLSHCLVMETGGMKGKRKEMTKLALHTALKKGLKVNEIHSEYGMTELLSQAYSKGLQFHCPPWMKILTREYNDPFSLTKTKTGGINIIDLANIHSCSFIATQDLGKLYPNHFEIMGRFDHSDLRGCNLLVQ